MTQHNNDLWMFKESHKEEFSWFTPDKVPMKWCPGWRHLLTFMHDSAPLDNNLRESVFPVQARLCLFARNGKDQNSQLLRLAASHDTRHPEAIQRLFWVFLCALLRSIPGWGIQAIDGFLTCPLAASASAETASVFICVIRLRILGSTTHRLYQKWSVLLDCLNILAILVVKAPRSDEVFTHQFDVRQSSVLVLKLEGEKRIIKINCQNS